MTELTLKERLWQIGGTSDVPKNKRKVAADKLGYSPRTIENLMNGSAQPSARFLMRLSEIEERENILAGNKTTKCGGV